MTSGRWSAILEFVVKPAAGTAVAVEEIAKTQAIVECRTGAVCAGGGSESGAVTLDRAAVQAFMINYVVDQTGYPGRDGRDERRTSKPTSASTASRRRS
jgi:hypothetical protein